jgi:dTDP-4-dehydrorhamnose reductase
VAAELPSALILRTNIVGLRGWAGQPTFAEWALERLRAGAPFAAFNDMWTSSIDVDSFGAALFDLVDRGAQGVLNVASRQSASKLEFIRSLARAAGLDASPAQPASLAASCGTPRANALGLDVRRAEALLGRALPDLDAVTHAIARHCLLELPHAA